MGGPDNDLPPVPAFWGGAAAVAPVDTLGASSGDPNEEKHGSMPSPFLVSSGRQASRMAAKRPAPGVGNRVACDGRAERNRSPSPVMKRCLCLPKTSPGNPAGSSADLRNRDVAAE